jgi:hypothetical protein
MKKVASFIHSSNGDLHDFEIVYSDRKVPFSSAATETHVVKSASIRNALASFSRTVPNHGPIKSVRKLSA